MTIKPQARALLAATALALAGLVATASRRRGHQPRDRDARAARHQNRARGDGGLFGNAFTEAPNGTVFFSRGSVVYAVEGDQAPAIELHAGHRARARGELLRSFVETGLLVTEYSAPTTRRSGTGRSPARSRR